MDIAKLGFESSASRLDPVKQWVFPNHDVAIVRYEYDRDDGPFVHESFVCSCNEHNQLSNGCEFVGQARLHLAEEAKTLYGDAWERMGPDEAITDIVRRVWKDGEWLGQYMWKLVYFQDLERLIGLSIPELDQRTYQLALKGLVGKDGYTVFPGQQMQLLERDMELDIRWFI